jgi:hypothetical protein
MAFASVVAVAQLVESQIVILVVVGSSPISHPKLILSTDRLSLASRLTPSKKRVTSIDSGLAKIQRDRFSPDKYSGVLAWCAATEHLAPSYFSGLGLPIPPNVSFEIARFKSNKRLAVRLSH